MNHPYSIHFREIFLVALIHLLVLFFFFFVKTPPKLFPKPLIVKSFSTPGSFEDPSFQVLSTNAQENAPQKSFVLKKDETKEVVKKEAPLQEVARQEKPLVQRKKAEVPIKKPLRKTPFERPIKKNIVSEHKEASLKSRAGERPKLERQTNRESKEEFLLQREVAKSLVKDLEEKIASLDKKPMALSSKQEMKVPSFVTSSSLDAKVESSSFHGPFSYQQKLISDLKNNLKLPEYGEVKLRMKISSKGEVVTVEVLSAQSERNKSYLQKELVSLRFLWFSKILPESPFYDFVITFQNENP
jgi:outer membrane biosynthesis protein TonB